MLRQHTAREGSLVAGDEAAHVRRAVRGVQRRADGVHQPCHDRVAATHGVVVEPNGLQRRQVHDGVGCQGRGAQRGQTRIQTAYEAHYGVDGGFAVREAVGIGHVCVDAGWLGWGLKV